MSKTAVSKTVVGVFKSKGQAEKAVEELRELGVDHREISIVTRDERRERAEAGRERLEARGDDYEMADMDVEGQDVGEGVAWGGGLGGLAGILAGAGALAVPGIGPILAAGPLAAVLTGAVTGGIAGGLVDYGVPEERGRDLERKVKEGGILTVIRVSEDRSDRVADVLRRSGAEDVESHESQ